MRLSRRRPPPRATRRICDHGLRVKVLVPSPRQLAGIDPSVPAGRSYSGPSITLARVCDSRFSVRGSRGGERSLGRCADAAAVALCLYTEQPAWVRAASPVRPERAGGRRAAPGCNGYARIPGAVSPARYARARAATPGQVAPSLEQAAAAAASSSTGCPRCEAIQLAV